MCYFFLEALQVRQQMRWERKQNHAVIQCCLPYGCTFSCLSSFHLPHVPSHFFVLMVVFWVFFVWVCKMGLLCKIPRTPIWIIPCANCISVALVKRRTMAWLCQQRNSPWQAQREQTPWSCSCAALWVPAPDSLHGSTAQGAGAAEGNYWGVSEV